MISWWGIEGSGPHGMSAKVRAQNNPGLLQKFQLLISFVAPKNSLWLQFVTLGNWDGHKRRAKLGLSVNARLGACVCPDQHSWVRRQLEIDSGRNESHNLTTASHISNGVRNLKMRKAELSENWGRRVGGNNLGGNEGGLGLLGIWVSLSWTSKIKRDGVEGKNNNYKIHNPEIYPILIQTLESYIGSLLFRSSMLVEVR